MKFAWIEDHKSKFRVKKMCNVLNVSASGYYDYIKRPESKRSQDNSVILEFIEEVFEQSDRTYGSPRVWKELQSMGLQLGENRVARLMRSSSITPEKPDIFRVKTTDSNHNNPVSPNLLKQDFRPGSIGSVYVSDITYIRTIDGFAYLSTVMDLGNREIIGWNLSRTLEADGVLDAIRKALLRRPMDADGIFHSDRGVQYSSKQVQNLLVINGIRQSMSGKGNCYDNAVQESFYRTLKMECIRRLTGLPTFKELKTIIFDYIEVFYNRKRRHSTLDYLSPVEYIKRIA